jgi:hypothetical protein
VTATATFLFYLCPPLQCLSRPSHITLHKQFPAIPSTSNAVLMLLHTAISILLRRALSISSSFLVMNITMPNHDHLRYIYSRPLFRLPYTIILLLYFNLATFPSPSSRLSSTHPLLFIYITTTSENFPHFRFIYTSAVRFHD